MNNRPTPGQILGKLYDDQVTTLAIIADKRVMDELMYRDSRFQGEISSYLSKSFQFYEVKIKWLGASDCFSFHSSIFAIIKKSFFKLARFIPLH